MNDLIPKYPYISEIKCTWSCPLFVCGRTWFISFTKVCIYVHNTGL